MNIRKLPAASYLRRCFTYDPVTGVLLWKKRPTVHFPTQANAITWNKRWAGKPALNFVNKAGYHVGNFDGKYCAAHRVIWKMMTGKEPAETIDHKNRARGDNRWTNLRSATKAQNCANKLLTSRNTSGLGGVHKHKNKNRWVAQIGAGDRKRYLGIFDSKEKAHEAWKQAMRQHYGEFAP